MSILCFLALVLFMRFLLLPLVELLLHEIKPNYLQYNSPETRKYLDKSYLFFTTSCKLLSCIKMV